MIGTTPDGATPDEPTAMTSLAIPDQPTEPAEQPPATPPPPATRTHPPRRAFRPSTKPYLALPSIILFGLLAAFFAWQSAEPFWLSIGQGVAGTVTQAHCDATDPHTAETNAAADADNPPAAHRPLYPCAVFETTDGTQQIIDVHLRGIGAATPPADNPLPALMLSPERDHAYAADTVGLHLRWVLGLALALACGLGVAWAGGATRLDTVPAQRRAMLLSFAGPLLLIAGFFAAAY